MLFTVFAFIALVLAAVGVYGVVASAVAARTREFGVRIALGAPPVDVQRMVFAAALRLTGMGLLLGLTGALLTGRLLEEFLFGVESTDAATMTVVALGLLAIALVAAWLPARRATRNDPLRALNAQ